MRQRRSSCMLSSWQNGKLDIVGALIEKVLVYDPRHVEIRWKFSDEVLKLLQG